MIWATFCTSAFVGFGIFGGEPPCCPKASAGIATERKWRQRASVSRMLSTIGGGPARRKDARRLCPVATPQRPPTGRKILVSRLSFSAFPLICTGNGRPPAVLLSPRAPGISLSCLLPSKSKSRAPPSPSSPIGSGEIKTHPSRYVLPKDLDAAIRQLDDQELDRLVSAALEERNRRKKHTVPEESHRKGLAKADAVPLPQGKLNAVKAAFRAGVTPARIAREFGISLSDVRKAIRL